MRLYVFGAGGHAKVVVSTALSLGMSVEGIFDDDLEKQGSEVLGIKVIGTMADAQKKTPECGVLAVGNNKIRQKLAQSLKGWEWVTLIHPKAYVHPRAYLGVGTVVFAGVVIQPDVRVGVHSIINTGATVDHDCEIGDFVHLAPGVNLAGNVRIGEGTFVGIGTVILPGVKIGAWTTIGAGTVVREDLPSGVTAVGVPARIVKTPTNMRG